MKRYLLLAAVALPALAHAQTINTPPANTSLQLGPWLLGATDAGVKFRINAGPAFGTNDRLVIDGSGNVGLGTAAPLARLQIQNLSSAIMGISINQTGVASGTVAGPVFLNDMQGNFSTAVTGTGAAAGVSGFHASLGVGGPNLVGNEFYGASFGVSHTADDTATGDKVGVNAGVSSAHSSNGKIYGASFSHGISTGGTTPQAIGVEADSIITGTGAADNRIGFNAWNGGTNVGTTFDSAFTASNSGAGSAATGAWQNLISLYTQGGVLQRALAVTGNFFFSDAPATVANIFNLSNVTVTGHIMLFPSVVLTGTTGMLGLGTAFSGEPTAHVDIAGSLALPSWTVEGIALRGRAILYTDTTGSGTIATRTAYSFGRPTFGSTNAVTLTGASTVYIAGPPNPGTNTTITNPASLIVAGGAVGLGTTAPIAALQLAQAGDDYLSGMLFSRTGTTAAAIWIDATDGSFNLSRATSVKHLSMNTSGGIALTALPTAAGAGGLAVCIDTAGVLYKKAACP